MDYETMQKLAELERRIAKLEKGEKKPAKTDKEVNEK